MISILPYKPTWPNEFLEKGRMLRNVLGDLALRIDHIGSTSVPGLAAKDILDIQVTAERLSHNLESAMNLAGFQRLANITQDHVPPGKEADAHEWEKWFFQPALCWADESMCMCACPAAPINAMPFYFVIIYVPSQPLPRHTVR